MSALCVGIRINYKLTSQPLNEYYLEDKRYQENRGMREVKSLKHKSYVRSFTQHYNCAYKRSVKKFVCKLYFFILKNSIAEN